MSSPPMSHRRELQDLGVFLLFVAAFLLEALVVPDLHAYKPWIDGEPVPLLHFVEEGPDPSVANIVSPEVESGWAEDDTGLAADSWERLPHRPPAHPTSLEFEEGLLDGFFQGLLEAEIGQPNRIVRVLHWGDSTIAADGVTGTVRSRLQGVFGDGGPGFLPVKVDPRWVVRPGVARWPKGDWASKNITQGGASFRRYGLSGIVARVNGRAKVTLGGLKTDGQRQLSHRFDVHYQRQPRGGTISLSADRGEAVRFSTSSSAVGDAFVTIEPDEGAAYLRLYTGSDGPVTVYGVSIETQGPGLTWETLAVAGSSVASMRRQNLTHLVGQVERRVPDLLVYQTGGNEMEYDSFVEADGEAFMWEYLEVLERIRAGAPEASCLLIGPIDQAIRSRGQVVSKPLMSRMVELQRKAAQQAGCAFWDPWSAMGGEGSYARWLNMEPPLAWTDLMHLSKEGRALIGESLADSILDAYDQWKRVQVALDTAPPGLTAR